MLASGRVFRNLLMFHKELLVLLPLPQACSCHRLPHPKGSAPWPLTQASNWLSFLAPPPWLSPSIPATAKSGQFYAMNPSLVPMSLPPSCCHHRPSLGAQRCPPPGPCLHSPPPPPKTPLLCNSQGHLLKTHFRLSHSLMRLQSPHGVCELARRSPWPRPPSAAAVPLVRVAPASLREVGALSASLLYSFLRP